MRKTKPSSPRSGSTPLLIALDRRTNLPLQRQIYTTVREAILGGRLTPGTRLPPSRILACDLGVSRTTVVLAYEYLETEGYITGRGSAGSFVASLRVDVPRARTAKSATRDAATEDLTRHALELARTASGMPRVRPAPVPFRIGEPAVDLFPTRVWARLYARRARKSGGSLLGYGSEHGYRPLREAIADYARAARGVNATADQVVLTRGTQQAIHLAARVLVSENDAVWVEDPGYLTARTLLAERGRIVPIPVDAEGLVVAEGIRRAPRARLAYVSPSHQFPLGSTMSLARRLALLEWAGNAGAWILEDDYDSEFRYSGSPIPSLQGLDSRDRVIYLGTFSKTMFPSLRLGYLILPPSLVDLFRATQALADHLAPNVEQGTLAEFIEDGHFSRHVRQMRAAYAHRQEALLRGVRRELDDVVAASPAETGMHLIAWLRGRSISDARVSRRAHELGVEAAPLSLYAVEVKPSPGLLLGFAPVRPSDLGAGLRTLREAIGTVARSGVR